MAGRHILGAHPAKAENEASVDDRHMTVRVRRGAAGRWVSERAPGGNQCANIPQTTLAMHVTGILSAILGLTSILFLWLSLILPMWVVGSFKGNGQVGAVKFEVDVNLGDGLWRRNVCFGKSDPQGILEKAGLSCKPRYQTGACDADDLSDECSRFFSAQVLQCLSVILAIMALLTFIPKIAERIPVTCMASVVCGMLAH